MDIVCQRRVGGFGEALIKIRGEWGGYGGGGDTEGVGGWGGGEGVEGDRGGGRGGEEEGEADKGR
jgi:hypothetical protein